MRARITNRIDCRCEVVERESFLQKGITTKQQNSTDLMVSQPLPANITVPFRATRVRSTRINSPISSCSPSLVIVTSLTKVTLTFFDPCGGWSSLECDLGPTLGN